MCDFCSSKKPEFSISFPIIYRNNNGKTTIEQQYYTLCKECLNHLQASLTIDFPRIRPTSIDVKCDVCGKTLQNLLYIPIRTNQYSYAPFISETSMSPVALCGEHMVSMAMNDWKKINSSEENRNV